MLSIKERYLNMLPLIYLFISVFVFRYNVIFVYFAAAILVISLIVRQRNNSFNSLQFLVQWMLVFSVIGLSAATILSIEKIQVLTNPDHIASCSLNPVIACSPVISSKQASVFGFANSFIGIFGFTAVFTAALTILAGAKKLNRVWWQTLFGGITFGVLFCMWLIYQGIFIIGRLCLYCLLVWLVTFGLFWLVLAYCIKEKHINMGLKFSTLFTKFDSELLLTTYVVIGLLILYRWFDYWFSFLG